MDINAKTKLCNIINEYMTFSKKFRPNLSVDFLKFIEDTSTLFTHFTEYQYILLPVHLKTQFEFYMLGDEKPVYTSNKHYHYIDPIMKSEFIYFCMIATFTKLFNKITDYFENHKNEEWMPLDVVEQEILVGYFENGKEPDLFHSICNCMNSNDLSNILPYVKKKEAVFVVQTIFDRHNYKCIPNTIHNKPIVNWIIYQECSLDIVMTLDQHGKHIQLPLKFNHLNNFKNQSHIDILKWCLSRSNVYPLDVSIDHLIMNNVIVFEVISLLIKNNFHPSRTTFGILLKKMDFNNMNEYDNNFFTNYTIKRLKDDDVCIEMWVETSWHYNQDHVIDLILNHGKEYLCQYMVTHICCNLLDIILANVDYWVLRFYRKYYICKNYIKIIRFSTNMVNVCQVDERIIAYIFEKDIKKQQELIEYPPFYEPHKEMIVFRDQNDQEIQIPVYFQYLRSNLLKMMASPNGFREKKEINDGVFILEMGLPDLFRDQKKTVCQWVSHCYTQQITFIEHYIDIIELYYLCRYLLDDVGSQCALEWLDKCYIDNFETHLLNQCIDGCALCASWRRMLD